MLVKCDVAQATHVQVDGLVQKISSKWGVDSNGRVSKEFGVVTEAGKSVSMWNAQLYFKEDSDSK